MQQKTHLFGLIGCFSIAVGRGGLSCQFPNRFQSHEIEIEDMQQKKLLSSLIGYFYRGRGRGWVPIFSTSLLIPISKKLK